jgi:hypothetical protein
MPDNGEITGPEKKSAFRKCTEELIEQMWLAYQEKQSDNYVAKKCRVANGTVRKYRERLGWADRLRRIRDKAAREADDQAAKRRARHIKLAQLAQKTGADYLMDAKKPISDGHTAIRAVLEGVRLEREIVGDEDKRRIRIDLTLPAGLEEL